MGYENFDYAAQWVHTRIPEDLCAQLHGSEVQQALAALDLVAKDISATFLIPDLFPGVALDVLYVHDVDNSKVAHESTLDLSKPLASAELSARAMTAIGTAIARELDSTGNDMMNYRLEGQAEIIVARPSARSLVLQATGTTLLAQH